LRNDADGRYSGQEGTNTWVIMKELQLLYAVCMCVCVCVCGLWHYVVTRRFPAFLKSLLPPSSG
jgi:hypothetical protein